MNIQFIQPPPSLSAITNGVLGVGLVPPGRYLQVVPSNESGSGLTLSTTFQNEFTFTFAAVDPADVILFHAWVRGNSGVASVSVDAQWVKTGGTATVANYPNGVPRPLTHRLGTPAVAGSFAFPFYEAAIISGAGNLDAAIQVRISSATGGWTTVTGFANAYRYKGA